MENSLESPELRSELAALKKELTKLKSEKQQIVDKIKAANKAIDSLESTGKTYKKEKKEQERVIAAAEAELKSKQLDEKISELQGKIKAMDPMDSEFLESFLFNRSIPTLEISLISSSEDQPASDDLPAYTMHPNISSERLFSSSFIEGFIDEDARFPGYSDENLSRVGEDSDCETMPFQPHPNILPDRNQDATKQCSEYFGHPNISTLRIQNSCSKIRFCTPTSFSQKPTAIGNGTPNADRRQNTRCTTPSTDKTSSCKPISSCASCGCRKSSKVQPARQRMTSRKADARGERCESLSNKSTNIQPSNARSQTSLKASNSEATLKSCKSMASSTPQRAGRVMESMSDMSFETCKSYNECSNCAMARNQKSTGRQKSPQSKGRVDDINALSCGSCADRKSTKIQLNRKSAAARSQASLKPISLADSSCDSFSLCEQCRKFVGTGRHEDMTRSDTGSFAYRAACLLH